MDTGETLKAMMKIIKRGDPYFEKASTILNFADQKRNHLYMLLENASIMSDSHSNPWENVDPKAKEMLLSMPLKEKVAVYFALNKEILDGLANEGDKEWNDIESAIEKFLQEV